MICGLQTLLVYSDLYGAERTGEPSAQLLPRAIHVSGDHCLRHNRCFVFATSQDRSVHENTSILLLFKNKIILHTITTPTTVNDHTTTKMRSHNLIDIIIQNPNNLAATKQQRSLYPLPKKAALSTFPQRDTHIPPVFRTQNPPNKGKSFNSTRRQECSSPRTTLKARTIPNV